MPIIKKLDLEPPYRYKVQLLLAGQLSDLGGFLSLSDALETLEKQDLISVTPVNFQITEERVICRGQVQN